MKPITENNIEQYTINELKDIGFQYVYGVDISPDGDKAERSAYDDIILKQRLLNASIKINPAIPHDACLQAVNEVLRLYSPDLLTNNEAFHKYLTDGVPVSYQKNGEEKNDYVWLIDCYCSAKIKSINSFLVKKIDFNTLFHYISLVSLQLLWNYLLDTFS